MDLIRLTQLSAWDFVMGRWLVSVFYAFFYFSLSIPYLALRYLLGDYSLVMGLQILSFMALGGLVLSALMLVSALTNKKGKTVGVSVIFGILALYAVSSIVGFTGVF